MEMKKVYLETSIVSYYTAQPSRDLIVAARQEITRATWPMLVSQFERYVSALVLQEAGCGDPDAAQRRLDAIAEIPVIGISQDARELARNLVAKNVLPKEYPEDALHVALACSGGMDFLLTWNFKHLNNVLLKSVIVRAVGELGLEAPEICSPEELLGE